MTQTDKSRAVTEISEAVQVADAIRRARTPADVWRTLKTFAEPIGFTQLTVLSALEPGADKLKPHVMYIDAPHDFCDGFDERRMLRNHPLIQQALTTAEPFSLRQIQARGLTFEQRKVLEYMGEALNVAAAFVVPVRREGKLAGIVMYGGAWSKLGPIERSILHLLGYAALSRVIDLKDAPKSDVGSDLSPREMQCLYWASKGKTDAEIGVILSISGRTARFHIENAKRKLGAATRVQAVAEAMRRHAIAA